MANCSEVLTSILIQANTKLCPHPSPSYCLDADMEREEPFTWVGPDSFAYQNILAITALSDFMITTHKSSIEG